MVHQVQSKEENGDQKGSEGKKGNILEKMERVSKNRKVWKLRV